MSLLRCSFAVIGDANSALAFKNNAFGMCLRFNQ